MTENHETPERQGAKLAYEQICVSHQAITTFRGKLLALLPIASVAAGIFVVRDAQTAEVAAPGTGLQDANVEWAGAIGVFGAILTGGLFVYELRQIQECAQLKKQGSLLETVLGVPEDCGQFRDGQLGAMGGLVGAEIAGWIIYMTVIVAWIFVAGVGFAWWGPNDDGYGRFLWVAIPAVVVAIVKAVHLLHRNAKSRKQQHAPATVDPDPVTDSIGR